MKHVLLALTLGGLVAAPVAAQQATVPPAATPARGGGLADLLGEGGLLGGGGLPNIASAGAGNAAGLLGYCIKNNLVAGNGAAGILGQLTGKRGVTASPGFEAGQRGQVQTGDSAFSLAGVQDRVKTQLCGMVLKRARSFL
ncbi:DUF2501 domain-containing protein [Sphingomonas sp. CFBP 8760]|uniref:DUF2501 domain-containing protein n=1 Tax=Sphingomonas sp. CFBP 8760 TaxID=2775282 RepID=UPI001784286D|nr:DUF2501 domain-containing protein [Sphingomonas sp. CFBP 8760]MBD8548060.1 DUF2501 domain-containing protein [Sphingomonas sp. CFBP 8760]